MHFGENQLSPGSIGVSPTTHSSSHGIASPTGSGLGVGVGRRLTLAMGRSPGFGSTPTDLVVLFRLGFPLASDLFSP